MVAARVAITSVALQFIVDEDRKGEENDAMVFKVFYTSMAGRIDSTQYPDE
jgi:hypothetical protein